MRPGDFSRNKTCLLSFRPRIRDAFDAIVVLTCEKVKRSELKSSLKFYECKKCGLDDFYSKAEENHNTKSSSYSPVAI